MEGFIWSEIGPLMYQWLSETWHVFVIGLILFYAFMRIGGYTFRDIIHFSRMPSQNARQVAKMFQAIRALDTKLDTLVTTVEGHKEALRQHEHLCDIRDERAITHRNLTIGELKEIKNTLSSMNTAIGDINTRVAVLEGKLSSERKF